MTKLPSREPLDRALPYPSDADLQRVFLAAAAGERIVYLVGYLVNDRQNAPAIDTVAAYAALLEQEGRAELVCRRIAPGHYEYSLKKRRELGEGCNWQKFQEEPYKVLSDAEPPREVRFSKERLRTTILRGGHLTPRQQHALDRAPYTRQGGR